eukprot:6190429-Pleurochrysis_carterae.AAC.2
MHGQTQPASHQTVEAKVPAYHARDDALRLLMRTVESTVETARNAMLPPQQWLSSPQKRLKGKQLQLVVLSIKH